MTETPSFTCPKCGATSYHPEDVRHGYCGRCHEFTGTDLSRLSDSTSTLSESLPERRQTPSGTPEEIP